MSFGRLTTAQIESGPLRKTQRTTARSPFYKMLRCARKLAIYAMQTFPAGRIAPGFVSGARFPTSLFPSVKRRPMLIKNKPRGSSVQGMLPGQSAENGSVD